MLRHVSGALTGIPSQCHPRRRVTTLRSDRTGHNIHNRHAEGGLHGSVQSQCERRSAGRRCRLRYAAALRAARQPRAERTQVRLRSCPMRLLHRPRQRRGGALLRAAHRADQGRARHHARRPRQQREAVEAAAGLYRRAGRAVRLLHQRHDHDLRRLAGEEQEPERSGDPLGARRQSLPLRHPQTHCRRCEARGRA